VPPFDSLAARQAVNYAIERSAVVALNAGGPGSIARPVLCQPGVMQPESVSPPPAPWGSLARTKLLVSLGAAAAAGVAAAAAGADLDAPLIGWDILALVFCGWVWLTVWRLGPDATASHAKKEDPSVALADLVLLGAALASLISVGFLLAGTGGLSGAEKYAQAGFALLSVFVSWTLVHTVFALKYARLYYSGKPGGIDFNEDDDPDYGDFAYLSFTIGMTFQVSDTNIGSKPMRRLALRHAWMSFPLGAVIIATAINLVSSLAK
jgi:uncharacterized membrane protein